MVSKGTKLDEGGKDRPLAKEKPKASHKEHKVSQMEGIDTHTNLVKSSDKEYSSFKLRNKSSKKSNVKSQSDQKPFDS